jgi:hypothetical protein
VVIVFSSIYFTSLCECFGRPQEVRFGKAQAPCHVAATMKRMGRQVKTAVDFADVKRQTS